jgi:hypothetical protein
MKMSKERRALRLILQFSKPSDLELFCYQGPPSRKWLADRKHFNEGYLSALKALQDIAREGLGIITEERKKRGAL